MQITISKMDRPMASGDWHDKPLRWQVEGPNGELQRFRNRDDARTYAKIREHSTDSNEAHRKFANS